jgi:hypothetical protein
VRASFEAIVRDPAGRTFAVPTIELDEFHEFHLVAAVNEEVERLCGTRVTTLRCLSSEPVGEDARHRRYELEAHGPVRGLAEVEVELPPPGNAWEAAGWFDTAAGWIRERIDAPVEQRSARSISALLHAGDAYFKAVPAVFAAEPAITRALAREHPGRVPEVIDVDVERGWLLMRDFGGERLSTSHPVDRWVEALRVYADLQAAWVGRTDELLAFGCPDRALPQLERDLDVVLADVDAMLPGRPEGLTDEQVAALPALRAWLREVAAGVGEFELPPTLDHGDLHAGNIALRASGPLVFDWSDGCLALPLVSVTPILEWDDQPEGAGTTLRDAYLERLGAPVAAYADSILLGLAHQAVSYHRIVEGIAPHTRWEWERVLPWLVKQLLERQGVTQV